jgi:hypothetical protein
MWDVLLSQGSALYAAGLHVWQVVLPRTASGVWRPPGGGPSMSIAQCFLSKHSFLLHSIVHNTLMFTFFTAISVVNVILPSPTEPEGPGSEGGVL